VAKVTQIRQGGDLPFSFDLDGESLDGRTCTIYVKQYIKDTATITREIPINAGRTSFDGFLTSAETKTLSVGLWHIFADIPNITTGEDRQIATGGVRFEVQQSVVDIIVETFFRITKSGDFRVTKSGDFRVTKDIST